MSGVSGLRPAGRLIALPLATLVACTAEPEPEPVEPVPARVFRIDHLEAPASDAVGIADIDGDGDPDDQAAFLLEHLFEIYADEGAAAAWQAQIDARLTGPTDWSIQVTDVGVRLVDAPLGALADLGGAGEDDGWHPVGGSIVTARIGDRREITGWIHGGLAPGYDRVIATAFLPWLNQFVGEPAGWADSLDVDGDGEIVLDELMGADLFRLLMEPDLDLDGDGIAESLSFGFPFHATETIMPG